MQIGYRAADKSINCPAVAVECYFWLVYPAHLRFNPEQPKITPNFGLTQSKPNTNPFINRIEIGTFSQILPKMSEKCRKYRIESGKPAPI